MANTTYYVHPQNGLDTNIGSSIDLPWKTLKYALGSTSPLKAGDTLFLRGGTEKEPIHYYETNISIRVKGDPGNPIVIKNYQNEVVVIDGRYNWRIDGNKWKLEDPITGIYSLVVKNERFQEIATKIKHLRIGGTFTYKEKTYALVPYKNKKSLTSRIEHYDTRGYYAGPGVFIESIPNERSKIYLRLQSPDPIAVLGNHQTFSPQKINLDPNDDNTQVSFVIQDHITRGFKFFKDDSAFHIEGIKLIHQPKVIFGTQGGSFNDFTLKNVISESPSALIEAGGGVKRDPVTGEDILLKNSHHIFLDGVEVDMLLPPWLAFNDFKSPPAVASSLEERAMTFGNVVHDITIRGCHFKNMRDAMYVGATLLALNSPKEIVREVSKVPDSVLIENCTFENILDDGINLVWANRDVVIKGNKFINVAGCISKQGGSGAKYVLEKKDLGRVYIHHNLFICRPKFNSRLSLYPVPQGFNPLKIVGPFATTHAAEGIGYSPWKIYHNTVHVISYIGYHLNKVIGGVAPILISQFDPDPDLSSDRLYNQEVYNNVFILEGDDLMLNAPEAFSGREIYDGNIYFRTHNSRRFSRVYKAPKSFTYAQSLEELKANIPEWEKLGIEANPWLRPDYRPIDGGEASKEGIDLMTFGLDGISEKLNYRGAFRLSD